MVNRSALFIEMVKNYPYVKDWAKLRPSEKQFVSDYLNHNSAKDKDTFALEVNRLFLDQVDKPKNSTVIWALLTSVNSKL